ncbi:uncharacterized protein LAESUDRAFT_665364 [Laetiporus sulphureus 93-53]|uniref:DUF6570 domain-containing protein n=1 Tax=Laetiporus sulphureus 93-53 TaxID=1314785 RepID=A0A165BCU6_9APHY|nr:uncharacterized protein LAESUDRAFT_665364 [Laetiporus sulphureus 93-53]KZT00762.1 hypothetical protein LAESUDRAFT_665364 [Laetiporus sulphureus 93-53]
MLVRHRLSRNAIVNGLWIGDVPSVLTELTFVEQMSVARIRHNSFIIKVTMGQHKMMANAIVFSQPIKKVYDILSPPVSDLEQVLTILFTGPTHPVESDFRRTPLLVRHAVVFAAG